MCSNLSRSSLTYRCITNSQASVKIKLDKFVEDFQYGRRQSTVISDQTVDSLSAEDRLTWRTLRKELEEIGITVAAFEANRDFILRWLKRAVETGAFEEQSAQGSDNESLQRSPSASSARITELGSHESNIGASTEVAHTTGHDSRHENRAQPPVSNSGPESSLDLATSLPLVARESSTQMRNSTVVLPVSAYLAFTCEWCGISPKTYELHMRCEQCKNGKYDLCLQCWRLGRGCMNWYGFGHRAKDRWIEKVDSKARGSPERVYPHFFTGRRYRLVTHNQPRRGENGAVLTITADLYLELQSGFFCSNCSGFAPKNVWVCDTCNDGEWAYCNSCVRRGRCCTHPLLPVSSFHPTSRPSLNSVTHQASEDTQQIRLLTVSVKCKICTKGIPRDARHFHCPQCNEGSYNICTKCYLSIGRISARDEPQGWRRCLKGHRMTIIDYEDSPRGQRRVIAQDIIGGHAQEERDMGSSTYILPPSRGGSLRVLALWSNWPDPNIEEGEDELSFPRGAEIRECEKINEDWSWGVYCSRKGLFPTNYCTKLPP